MSETSQFRQYAEEALRWADRSTTEKEKRTYDRACVHMGASGSREREARGRKLAASLGGSMDTTTLLLIIIVVVISFWWRLVRPWTLVLRPRRRASRFRWDRLSWRPPPPHLAPLAPRVPNWPRIRGLACSLGKTVASSRRLPKLNSRPLRSRFDGWLDGEGPD